MGYDIVRISSIVKYVYNIKNSKKFKNSKKNLNITSDIKELKLDIFRNISRVDTYMIGIFLVIYY